MTGKEIKDYLEFSYDSWINTIDSADDHVLKIVNAADPRTGQSRWSFVNRSYNFDSAAGLIYKVDVTKPMGERIRITTLVDGSAFDLTKEYNVAMTSYRASGGGDIMRKGAGVDTDRIGDRVVEYHPEIRNILYDYLKENGKIATEAIGDVSVIGEWKFIPEEMAEKALERDMELLFK
jgi:2',3'-cyclic-nucleotide 2'-phosphodiesterase/3'-nucleotidase